MRLLFSPTKTMAQREAGPEIRGLPVFLDRTQRLLDRLLELEPEQLQALWGCNDALARQNLLRLQEMDLQKGLTPALLTYEGIAFQYLAPETLSAAQSGWLQEQLRILSGFYGVLKPFDGIRPYRLEMQAKLAVDGAKDLYGFWGNALCREVTAGQSVVLNLASREYAVCIRKHLPPDCAMIDFVFGETVDGAFRQKATFAKMARGAMVRFLAEQEAQSPEHARGFDRLGFRFCPARSSETEYVFEKTE